MMLYNASIYSKDLCKLENSFKTMDLFFTFFIFSIFKYWHLKKQFFYAKPSARWPSKLFAFFLPLPCLRLYSGNGLSGADAGCCTLYTDTITLTMALSASPKLYQPILATHKSFLHLYIYLFISLSLSFSFIFEMRQTNTYYEPSSTINLVGRPKRSSLLLLLLLALTSSFLFLHIILHC